MSSQIHELALFAGGGGGILGSYLMGWKTICAVERDAYAAQILVQRQNDGILPPFPVWSDVCSFDGTPWNGIIDVISGGFPCQDISSAGKGAGIDGDRSGLWSEMARIIGEVRPSCVFVENSPMLVGRGLARVISDLAQMGYDAEWTRFSASNFGAPHVRDRIWLVGYPTGKGLPHGAGSKMAESGAFKESERPGCNVSDPNSFTGWIKREEEKYRDRRVGKWKAFTTFYGNTQPLAYTEGFRRQQAWCSEAGITEWTRGGSRQRGWWAVEPGMGRVAHGVACRVDRLKAVGNGQVPVVAKGAFEFLGGAV